MRLKRLSAVAASMAMIVMPVAASAQPVENPASSLSIGKGVRSSAPTTNANHLAGGAGIYAILILAGIAAIIAIGVSNDNNSDSP